MINKNRKRKNTFIQERKLTSEEIEHELKEKRKSWSKLNRKRLISKTLDKLEHETDLFSTKGKNLSDIQIFVTPKFDSLNKYSNGTI